MSAKFVISPTEKSAAMAGWMVTGVSAYDTDAPKGFSSSAEAPGVGNGCHADASPCFGVGVQPARKVRHNTAAERRFMGRGEDVEQDSRQAATPLPLRPTMETMERYVLPVSV